MAFTKAAPKQAKLKVSVYGPPGSGKTFTTLLFAEGLAAAEGKRVAYVDTERGTDFYAKTIPDRKVHPDAFDFDAVYTKSLKTAIDECKGLDPAKYGVIVIDSISHLWDAAIEAYDGKKSQTKGGADRIPFGAWADIKRPYKGFIKWLVESPFHVFVLGRQKAVYEDTPDGGVTKVGLAMRAEGETQYEPHICLRMEAKADPADKTKSTYLCYVEKDRSGVLAGKLLLNPNFNTIKPLLSIIGGTEQAADEDDDERVAKDGDLLDAADEKAAAKAAKSSALMTELQAKISSATTPLEVGAFAAEMTKQKRYLLEEHLNALRALYEVKRGQVANRVMGEVKETK